MVHVILNKLRPFFLLVIAILGGMVAFAASGKEKGVSNQGETVKAAPPAPLSSIDLDQKIKSMVEERVSQETAEFKALRDQMQSVIKQGEDVIQHGRRIEDRASEEVHLVVILMEILLGFLALIAAVGGLEVWGVRRLRAEISDTAKKIFTDLEDARDNAKRNIEALVPVCVAYLSVTIYITQLGQTADASMKTKLFTTLDGELTSMNHIIDKYKDTDIMVLAWAFTLRGTIRHLREEFDLALKDFESSLEISPDSGPTLFNAACSACRLGLKEKALSYIERVLQIQPGRRAEAKTDSDLELVWDSI